MSSHKQGFTLLELSIVIVIIGLIVAGISAGQSLVHAANVRSSLNDLSKYDAAYSAFKLQYDYLPGDMPNASDYWPSSGVVDGNGNGYINATDVTHAESLASWQHLSLAGLVDGSYAGSGSVAIGVTHPETAYNTGRVTSIWPRIRGGINSVSTFSSPERPGAKLALTGISWWGWINYGVSVQDAAAMDAKIDDGIPDVGKFSCWNCTNFWGTPLPCATYASNYEVGNNTRCTCDYSITVAKQ